MTVIEETNVNILKNTTMTDKDLTAAEKERTENVTNDKAVNAISEVSQFNMTENHLSMLKAIESKVLWLSSWMIHNANRIRPNRDQIKVGGHQASSASLSTIMTALYFHILSAEDRVAVKPHASPNFHAIQYLLGNQSLDQLKRFRSFGGAQSYPSITKDQDDVDFSTGSVGLGVAATLFSSIVQDYLHDHQLVEQGKKKGRMIALLGDAELDEGNIYEALLEGWKKNLTNTWWIIDYNRQSLDAVISEHLFARIKDIFQTMGWRVIELKYGHRLQQAFQEPFGESLKSWLDSCPNQLYSALTFKGGDAWRSQLAKDCHGKKGLKSFLKRYDDEQLHELMTNLAGHDMLSLIHAFESIEDEQPCCFIAYTIKGWGLPLAGHKDNHSGMMTDEQIKDLQETMQIEKGMEWEPTSGFPFTHKECESFFNKVPFQKRYQRPRDHESILKENSNENSNESLNDGGNEEAFMLVKALEVPSAKLQSTQVAFGKLMQQLSQRNDELSRRIVTTSPDVASSTNLSAWLNKRGVYHTNDLEDTFKLQNVPSPIKWQQSPMGQHIELGIAESNLFTLLSSAGLAQKHFGSQLIPIGTLYDPFICRGLDAMNYACYQDARFILVATPSGISLAPEGGAHQSGNTPLIGMAQDNLVYVEPAYADELTILFQHALENVQQPKGSSFYFRLSTRSLPQLERHLSIENQHSIIDGGYWLKKPKDNSEMVIVYSGAIAPEAMQAWEALVEDIPGMGLLSVTSSDQLHRDWQRSKINVSSQSPIEEMLAELHPNATLVTVCDSHPATLSWLGSVKGHKVEALGVEKFGQSGDTIDLYEYYGIDTNAILNACARACLTQ